MDYINIKGGQMHKILLVILFGLLLTGCSGVKKLSIFKEEVKRQELNLNKPSPLVLERIKWHIITSENAEEVFAKLEAEGIDPVLFGLTDKDFQLIAKNFACLLYTSPSPRDPL